MIIGFISMHICTCNYVLHKEKRALLALSETVNRITVAL